LRRSRRPIAFYNLETGEITEVSINNRDYRRDPREPRINMNERIRHPEIRVLDETGSQLGIMPTREALARARGLGLDLIEVAPQAQPPVCRIIDYGKFKYEQSKREREAAKKQKQSDLKGIKMFPHIDDHDFDVKVRSALKFLQDGDKVKVTVAFKGREITHPEFGRIQMEKILTAAATVGGQVEKPPAMEGKQMIMILSPRSTATKSSGPSSAPKPAPKTDGPRPAAKPAPVAEAPAVQAAAPAPAAQPAPAETQQKAAS
jgi:translation initiation factor IF-3